MNPLLPDDPNSKLNACVRNVLRIWEEGKADSLTQLLFCDLSTPKNDGTFNVYDDIKAKLMTAGVPEKEIAFIHTADTEAKKKELFAKVRTGQVRVLLGSTQKMGAGTNCQDRLVALHHLDVGWRPSDMTQRNGRIIRQGNMNKEVQVYQYVTEGTFDAYLYQASVYKGYKRDKIEMRVDRVEVSDFPLYLNAVAGRSDCQNQNVSGFSFVVEINAVPVIKIIRQLFDLLGRYGFDAQIGYGF